MYRILIVDDEENIARGLAFLIQRKMTDCDVQKLAFDGEEGYRIARREKPDIILSDIRMPGMDGLEMIRELKREGCESRFIILSGYEDFEYARSALRLGVEDYITKPVEEERLYAVIQKVCDSIAGEWQRRQQVANMEDRLKDYSVSVKEFLLQKLLQAPIDGQDSLLQELETLGFPCNCRQYECIVLECYDQKLSDRLYEEMKEQIKQQLSFCCSIDIIPDINHQAVIIAAQDRETKEQELTTAVRKIRCSLEYRLNNPVSAGIGKIYRSAGSIHQSFEEARCAINYKVIKGDSCVINYEDIRHIEALPAGTSSVLILDSEMKELESAIDRIDNIGCREAVEKIFIRIGKEKNVSPEKLQLMSLNLILSGIRKVPFIQLQLNEYLGRNILSLESVEKFRTMEQLKNWIINVLCSMNELMLTRGEVGKGDVVEEVKKYLNKNYYKDTSLTYISENFHINLCYFSQLFKKKTGMTYQTYLMNLRIDRGKKLLMETDMKVYEIAEMVGYVDNNHFSRVFERIVGCKPSEYRSRNKAGECDA